MLRRRGSDAVLAALGNCLGVRGWRRGPVPEALLVQAAACTEVAARAACFFREPSADQAVAVREAGRKARRESAALHFPAGRTMRRSWPALALKFSEAAEATAAAVAEAERFGVSGVPGWAAMAAGLRDAGRELVAALESFRDRPACEAHMVKAKQLAAQATRLERGARAAALADPNAVTDLKVRTVLRRWAHAAEAWQQAADGIAEILGT